VWATNLTLFSFSADVNRSFIAHNVTAMLRQNTPQHRQKIEDLD
jgi:hypothetical protein